MDVYPFTLAAPAGASDTKFIEAAFTFLRYDEETTGASANRVIFRTDRGDRLVLKPGQSVELERVCSRVSLENRDLLSTLTGSVVLGGGVGVRVNDSNITGSVIVTNQTASASLTPLGFNVTNASQVLLAANSARKALTIQNQSDVFGPAVDIVVRCNGTAAVNDNTGVRIPPGGTWEPAVVPTGELRAIASAATAANNVHVEHG